MKANAAYSFGITLFLAWLAGCAAVENPIVEHELSWDRREIQQIAFLPVQAERPDEQEAAAVLQHSLFLHLSRIPEFQLMDPLAVEEIFRRNELLEDEKWRRLTPQQLGEMLGTDLLLEVKLLNTQTTYLIVQSRIAAGAEIKLVDPKNGETVFLSRKGVTATRSVTGLPFTVFEPLRGMGAVYYRDLLRQLSIQLVRSLSPVPSRFQQEITPRVGIEISQKQFQAGMLTDQENDNEAVGSPTIESATAHFTRKNQQLTVRVTATPNCRVSFRFPGLSGLQPCREISLGEYRGGFWFPEGLGQAPERLTIRVIQLNGAPAETTIAVEPSTP